MKFTYSITVNVFLLCFPFMLKSVIAFSLSSFLSLFRITFSYYKAEHWITTCTHMWISVSHEIHVWSYASCFYFCRVSPRPSIAPFDGICESNAGSPEKPIRKFNPRRLIRSRTMPAILNQQKLSPNEAPRRHSHQMRGMYVPVHFSSPGDVVDLSILCEEKVKHKITRLFVNVRVMWDEMRCTQLSKWLVLLFSLHV